MPPLTHTCNYAYTHACNYAYTHACNYAHTHASCTLPPPPAEHIDVVTCHQSHTHKQDSVNIPWVDSRGLSAQSHRWPGWHPECNIVYHPQHWLGKHTHTCMHNCAHKHIHTGKHVWTMNWMNINCKHIMQHTLHITQTSSHKHIVTTNKRAKTCMLLMHR